MTQSEFICSSKPCLSELKLALIFCILYFPLLKWHHYDLWIGHKRLKSSQNKGHTWSILYTLFSWSCVHTLSNQLSRKAFMEFWYVNVLSFFRYLGLEQCRQDRVMEHNLSSISINVRMEIQKCIAVAPCW